MFFVKSESEKQRPNWHVSDPFHAVRTQPCTSHSVFNIDRFLLSSDCRVDQPSLPSLSKKLGSERHFPSIIEAVFLRCQDAPRGRTKTPEDIGSLVVFHASDKARMITGAVVAVDGGNSL
ncbi:MAG: SDR family oxidoreductase [Proteobacteria bacterium]|nr:SDR family oxidoreductase [Pseudomonadota bacterium]